MQLFNRISEAMDARRRRQDRQAAVIFGVGCAFLIVVAIVFFIVGAIISAVETRTVMSTYGEAYANACQPVPAGQIAIENMPAAEAPRGVLLLAGDTTRRHGWHSELPTPWRAESEADVVLIGCVVETDLSIETCEYTRPVPGEEPFTVRIEREQHEVTLVLINPQTGRRIDALTVTGTEPAPCPVDDGEFNSGTQSGEPVVWEAFAEWVEGYVFDS